jgi:hypothetical protein
MPKQDAILAIIAGVSDMQVTLNLVWEKFLPVMVNNPLPGFQLIGQSLVERL